jgi:tRNA-modifying protein YgfZ
MSTAQDVGSADQSDPRVAAESAAGRLRHIGLLRFTGPDAHSFLQGQVSNDTRRLSAGAPLLAAYSTPQGRVIAVLHFLPHSSGVIGLLPREILQPTLARLRKFVLRAKVNIADLSEEYGVVGLHAAPPRNTTLRAIPGAAAGYVEQDGIGMAQLSERSSRRWVIGPLASLEEHGLAGGGPGSASGEAEEAERVEQAWRLADIRAGLPQVYTATSELFVAQMLNLDLIDGISFTKGCFTGQEIIARTQHLGRIKRRMFRLRLPGGSFKIGQAIRLTDGRAGRLTELAPQADQFEALAVLNIDAGAADADAAPSDAVAAVELPLPYHPGER